MVPMTITRNSRNFRATFHNRLRTYRAAQQSATRATRPYRGKLRKLRTLARILFLSAPRSRSAPRGAPVNARSTYRKASPFTDLLSPFAGHSVMLPQLRKQRSP